MVKIDKVNFAYKKTSVFEDVSLQTSTGLIYGVLGKNGAGKSTLLHCIAGLLRPQSGNINVLGFTPWQRKATFLEEVFMIPEEFHLPDISIARLAQYYGELYPRFNKEQFYGHLETFTVPPDQTLLKMSYGQKKKVLISFGLACNVSLLLMDEPSNGLDIISKGQFRQVVAGTLNENRSILISSHQVQDLANLIDHVIILDNTQVLLQRSLQTIGTKLCFKMSSNANEIQNALYSEPGLSGSALVTSNSNEEETNINLELLYKATMANPQGIQYALND